MFVFGGGGGGTSTTRGGGGCGGGTTQADSIAAMQRPGPRRTRPNVETKCAIGRSTQEGTATYRRNISVFQQLRFSPGAASPASKTHTVIATAVRSLRAVFMVPLPEWNEIRRWPQYSPLASGLRLPGSTAAAL